MITPIVFQSIMFGTTIATWTISSNENDDMVIHKPM
jgi:hypothetical protein